MIARALAKAASDRYQTADEFRRALTQLDPALAATGISRISVVAPAPPDPAATLATPTPPMSAPMTTSVPPSSPATLVLTRPQEAARGLPVPPERAGPTAVPEQPQRQSRPTPAAAPPVAPAPSGTMVAPAPTAPPAAPHALGASARARRRSDYVSAVPGATTRRRSRVPIAIAAALLLSRDSAASFWRAHGRIRGAGCRVRIRIRCRGDAAGDRASASATASSGDRITGAHGAGLRCGRASVGDASDTGAPSSAHRIPVRVTRAGRSATSASTRRRSPHRPRNLRPARPPCPRHPHRRQSRDPRTPWPVVAPHSCPRGCAP